MSLNPYINSTQLNSFQLSKDRLQDFADEDDFFGLKGSKKSAQFCELPFKGLVSGLFFTKIKEVL